MIIKRGIAPEKVLYLWLGLAVISLLPFFITDLALLHYSEIPACLAMGIGSNLPFVLAEWIRDDGYIKLAVFAFVIFCVLVSREVRNKNDLVACCGNVLTMYYLFEFGWLVTGSVVFWGYPQNHFDPFGLQRTYVYCEGSAFDGYMWARLIIGYILLFVNLAASRVRGGDS